MSDDNNKNIPTLEDIIRPGDLNKAVIGDLNQEQADTVSEATLPVETTTGTRINDTIEPEDDSIASPADAGTDPEDQEQPDEQHTDTTNDKRQAEDRRIAERRESSQPLPENIAERRITQRRGDHRRETDKQRDLNLNQLVEKIMQDMMPDLEQHFRLQLRFELEKHLPHSLFDTKVRNED